jgi:uncharacterized iron-regulated membrane protein
LSNAVQFWTRKAHRWLGLLIGIQLLLWTASGLYFGLIPIETIRGEDRIREAEPVNFAFAPLVSPARAIAALVGESGPSVQVRAVQLRKLLGHSVYEIRYDLGGESHIRLADAGSGALLPSLSREQAEAVAREDFASDAVILATEFIEQVAPGDEYRNGPLPAWRVRFDDPDAVVIYVVAQSGKVGARRNDRWRLFDLMWMLHILDFENRDNFNTLLLQFLASLGIVTILSGFILWGMTTSLFRSR